jgi:very-short-patch-repair endonuclease
MALGEKAESLNTRLDAFDRGIPRAWYDFESVSKFRGLVAVLIAGQELQKVRQAIVEAEKPAHEAGLKPQSSIINHRIKNAIRNSLSDEFVRCHEELARLWEYRRSFEERNRLLSEIKEKQPEFAQTLMTSFSNDAWDDRINSLQAGWNWLCADRWLSEISDSRLEDSLNLQVVQAQKNASHALSQLAAEKAWQHCMESMNEGRFQSLMAWQKAIKSAGKGTGKYAEHHRRIARQCLERCRDAIPAWVMPLYKVLDTVTVNPQAFDVVIVDEASQCGPDAWFFAYLAKQLIVVGDDEQIRPDYIGVEHGVVHQLQDRFLSDNPNAFLFGPPHSLFSGAGVFFHNPIRLREHFRCMPEIIAFSNRLCYQDKPLIPLRQFGTQRLTPVLQTHYVTGGYQEKRKSNPIEADAVVAAIERCCEDPAYTGKTFGVISLLHSSDQAHEIENRLIKRLDAEEIEQRNIVCGDAYDFQGDERDVIFLSMVSARSDQGRIHTMSDETAKRRFNVAVSRARDQLHLFHSVQEGELGQNCLRRRLLLHMKEPLVDPTAQLPWTIEELRQIARSIPRKKGNQPNPFDSWFEVDVFLAITAQGYQAIPQYEIYGYRIDIVIIGGSQKIAVECDGDYWHGPGQHMEEHHRQTQLERCGWEFFRIRGSRFYRDPDGSLLPLWKMLNTTEKRTDREPSPFGLTMEQSEDKDKNETVSDSRARTPGDTDDESEYRTDIDNDEEDEYPLPIEIEKRTKSSRRTEKIFNHSANNAPKLSLDQVLSMTSREMGRVICEILEECPNSTSKKDDLTKRVCKYLNLITRGDPRNKLNKKIGWAVTHLKRAGKITEYKTSKNIRVRLLQHNNIKQYNLF